MVHGWLRRKAAQGSGVALLLPLYFLQRSRLVEALHAYQELQQSGAAQGGQCQLRVFATACLNMLSPSLPAGHSNVPQHLFTAAAARLFGANFL